MATMTPFFWLDGRVEEAAEHYLQVFGEGEITERRVFPAGTPALAGDVMSVTVRVAGQEIILFNGGPQFPQTPAASLFVLCEDQAEVDRLWDGLCDGGEPSRCGWLLDRFGISWQIVPRALGELIESAQDPARAERVATAMMGMDKIIIADLEAAAGG